MNLFEKWKSKGGIMNIPTTNITFEGNYRPTKSNPEDVGYDVYCTEDTAIEPFEKVKLNLQLKLDIPAHKWIMLVHRSSTGSKNPLLLTNCVGVIDPKYKDECMASVINLSPEKFQVRKGERYFQMIIMDRQDINFQPGTIGGEKRAGGFGSSGQ